MDFDKVLEKRENVKKFTSKKPPAEQIVEAIQASNATPTPGNVHNFIYIVVEDPESISRIADACQQDFIKYAPYVIVICSDNKQLKKLYGAKFEKYLKHSVGASVNSLTMKLIDLRLASYWIEAFSEPILRNTLGIPDSKEIELVIPVGYEMGRTVKRRKTALINQVFFDGWGNKFHKPLIKIRKSDV